MRNKKIEICVELLEEGTPTLKGTHAISLRNDLYEVLATDDYDPEDEIWEFVPGSVVKLEKREAFYGEYLHAISAD